MHKVDTFYNLPFHRAFYVLIFFLIPGWAFSQWEELNPPRGGSIYGLETDGDAVLTMMPNGIYRYKPGTAWKKCLTQNFESLGPYFHYENGIFYANDGSVLTGKPILYSTNQGDNWQQIQNFRFDKGAFQANGTHGFVKYLDSLFVTDDFGAHWTYRSGANPSGVKMSAYNIVGDTVAVFLANSIQRSFDSGDTWETIPVPEIIPAGSYLRTLAVKDVWYMKYSFDGNLYRSNDNGDNWTLLGNVNIFDNLWRIGDRLYAQGSSYSDDLGQTWTNIDVPGNLADVVHFENKLIAGGGNGLLEDAGNFLWHSLNTDFPVPLNTNLYDETRIVSTKTNLLVSSGFYSPDQGQNWYFPQNAQGIGSYFAAKGDTVVCNNLANNQLQYTVDGGQTWDALPTGAAVSPFCPVFIGDTLFAITVPDKVWYTTDLGQNWYQANAPQDILIYNLAEGNGRLYLLDNDKAKVYRSSDGAQTWQELSNSMPSGQFYFKMFANESGVFIAPQSGLYRYDEISDQWIVSNAGITGNGSSIQFMTGSGNKVAAIRYDFNLLYLSPDGGKNWYDPLIAGLFAHTFATAAGFSDDYLYASAINGDNNTRHLLRRPLSAITDLPVTGQIAGMIQPGVPNVVVRLRSGNGETVPAPNSFYELHGVTGIDTVELAPIAGYSGVQPDFWAITQGGPSYNFSLGTPNPVCGISLTAFTPFKADVETQIALDLGCIPDTGQTVTANIFLPPNLTFVNAQPAPSSVNGSNLQWIGLQQNNSGFPEINLTVRTDMQVQIDDEIIVRGEFKKGNITFKDTLTALVVSSFDPNDKQCQPTRLSLQQGVLGAILDYTVRFQNTGNSPAQTVRIRDTLASNIEVSSIQLVAGSHPVNINILPGHVLEFLFNDIMLPDSNVNEIGSHGFVRFTARTKPGLANGDSVLNKAAIYFDLNVPIITNTCSSVVGETTSAVGATPFIPTIKLQISPNPASDKVMLTVPGYSLRGTSITVTDASGKIKHSWKNSDESAFEFSADQLSPGIWFINVRHNDWTATGSLSVLH